MSGSDKSSENPELDRPRSPLTPWAVLNGLRVSARSNVFIGKKGTAAAWKVFYDQTIGHVVRKRRRVRFPGLNLIIGEFRTRGKSSEKLTLARTINRGLYEGKRDEG